MSDDSINFLLTNKDIVNFALIFIGNILVVVGWIIVFWLGLSQQKKQLQNNAKMKIYEELYEIKKELDECSVGLGLKFTKFSLPFLAMSWEKEPNANLKALEHWRKYLMEISEESYSFSKIYSKLWNHSEMWISAMPELKKAKKELFEKQLNNLSKKISAHHIYLQNLSIKQFNWKLWNRQEIEKKHEEVNSLFNAIACGYVDDYLALIHNRLVAPILGHRKKLRENFANLDKAKEYYVLTEKGLEKIVNKRIS